MSAPKQLKVISHVGRDVLASAAAFKNEAVVVWEYVANSLQYVDRGVSPRVQVRVASSNRSITISDNGRGMSPEDLQHFFTMHGENRERRAGTFGRGKFGTGKSAAFGIANVLRVDTVRNGRRNVVSLSRSIVERSSGKDIPIEWEVRDEAASAPNGTTISIEDVILATIRTAPIVEYIERHLQAFRALGPEVAVNSHVCIYREPEIETEHQFSPSPTQVKSLGDITLTIKVSRTPLPESEQGIAVTAGVGNLIAVERGGMEAKEFGNYLFGEVDVPAIEASESKIAPYDPTRSLQLNPQHPVVAVLLGFIGSKLEQVRCELVRKSREARKTEQARRLAQEADKIADILNQDFQKVRERLQEIRAASSRPGAAGARCGDARGSGVDATDWIRGTQEPGELEARKRGSRGGGRHGAKPPDLTQTADRDEAGSTSVDPAGGSGKRSRPRGGFRVDYRNLGKNEERSRYDSASLTILINLDNAVVAAALGDGKVEDPGFRRLSYEVAFSEYAMALGYELLNQDPNISADDLLYEVRSTLNRVAGSAAALYR